MSTSSPEPNAAFVAQSGIIAWDDPRAIVDWRFRTISVVAPELAGLAPIARAILRRPDSTVSRCHVARTERGIGRTQRHLLRRTLATKVPGFDTPVIVEHDSALCTFADLLDVAQVNLDYLTAYRTTVIVRLLSGLEDRAVLCAAFADRRGIGGEAIGAALGIPQVSAVQRVLDKESYCVFQEIGRSDAVASTLETLKRLGVQQENDPRTLIGGFF